jgi:hypothetical protein
MILQSQIQNCDLPTWGQYGSNTQQNERKRNSHFLSKKQWDLASNMFFCRYGLKPGFKRWRLFALQTPTISDS